VSFEEDVALTPPGYLIPGTASDGVRLSSRSRASLRLEYGGDIEWVLAEHSIQSGSSGLALSGGTRVLLGSLRRVAKSVSSFFF